MAGDTSLKSVHFARCQVFYGHRSFQKANFVFVSYPRTDFSIILFQRKKTKNSPRSPPDFQLNQKYESSSNETEHYLLFLFFFFFPFQTLTPSLQSQLVIELISLSHFSRFNGPQRHVPVAKIGVLLKQKKKNKNKPYAILKRGPYARLLPLSLKRALN